MSRYSDVVRAPPYYLPPRQDDVDDDENIDLSALADQYLDLSEHCPMPSRSTSPYSDSTHTSDNTDLDLPPAKRRRITEVSDHRAISFTHTHTRPQNDIPHLPRGDGSDEEWDQHSSHGERHEQRTGLSPFDHRQAPMPSQDTVPPARPHHAHDADSHHTHPAAHVHAPALKFSAAHKDGRSKRQPLACFFCRERKIACGGPPSKKGDQTCK
jgi:hypothetical protein